MKETRLISEENGFGKVLADDKEVATVRYSVQTFQTFIVSRGTEIPNVKSARGHLSAIDGVLDFRKKGKLKLVLEDGRQWGFRLLKPEKVSGNHEIRITSQAEGE